MKEDDSPKIHRFFDPDERLNKVCPKCGNNEIVFILYGFTDFSEELDELIANKQVVLGGCLVSPENLFCTKCNHAWGSCGFDFDLV